MNTLVATYWPAIVAALVIGLVLAWYLFHASRRTRVTGARRDVLDEGAAPAARNAALIDAPPAATREAVNTPAPVAPASPAPAPVESAPVAAPPVSGDIARLKGVGPKLVARLSELGVTTLEQVAEWGEADIDRIDAQLDRFAGRIRRDDWVGQAKLLTSGDEGAYAARYGAPE